jgi:MFS family permease
MADSVTTNPKVETLGNNTEITGDVEKLANTGVESPVRRQPFGAVWVVVACGFALMSDGASFFIFSVLIQGYLNSVVGIVNTLLGKIYPETYPDSSYSKNITSIVFVGTVVGMLVFGYFSDKLGRKFGMIAATIIVVLFSILSAGAYGAGGSTDGMLAALAAYRFFLGIGIGAEYPAGSVAAGEGTNEAKKGHRHALFVMVTNFVIDFGWVIGGFVPLVLLVFHIRFRGSSTVDFWRGPPSSSLAYLSWSRRNSSSLCFLFPSEDERSG